MGFLKEITRLTSDDFCACKCVLQSVESPVLNSIITENLLAILRVYRSSRDAAKKCDKENGSYIRKNIKQLFRENPILWEQQIAILQAKLAQEHGRSLSGDPNNSLSAKCYGLCLIDYHKHLSMKKKYSRHSLSLLREIAALGFSYGYSELFVCYRHQNIMSWPLKELQQMIKDCCNYLRYYAPLIRSYEENLNMSMLLFSVREVFLQQSIMSEESLEIGSLNSLIISFFNLALQRVAYEENCVAEQSPEWVSLLFQKAVNDLYSVRNRLVSSGVKFESKHSFQRGIS